jgi:hypothetical protein
MANPNNPFAPANIGPQVQQFLTGMGDTIAKSREASQRKRALAGLIGDSGEVDYRKAASVLLGMGDATNAARFARMAQSGGVGKPMTELGRLAYDERAGYVSPDIAAARRGMLTTRQGRQTGTIESIRSKLASGEPLTPGEQQVYEDALSADPINRLLRTIQTSPGSPTAGLGMVTKSPSPQSVDYLKKNAGDASVRAQFDEMFGQGAASRALGGR